MKKPWFLILALVAVVAGIFLLGSARPFPELRGEYLGQKPPAAVPELFAPGIVSTRAMDSVPVFSPDGHEVYWSRLTGRGRSEILVSRLEKGLWTRPRALPFCGGELDARPSLTGDGSRMLFVSRRTVDSRPPAPMCFRLWTTTRDGEGWGAPAPLAPPLDSGFEDFSVIAADGTIYLSSWKPGGPGTSPAAIYASRLVDGRYQEPQRLPDTINAPTGALAAYVAPDQRYLVFERIRADETTDLFVSHRQADGSWGPGVDLGPAVNSPGYEHFASLSADGKYFFFASDRGGNLDVYWMAADFLAAKPASQDAPLRTTLPTPSS